MDYNNNYLFDEKAALDPSECELVVQCYRTCKCGKNLKMFQQRRLSKNYGRRFLKCPDYVLPIGPDGIPMLPIMTDWSVLPWGPKRCHFEWIDDSYPEAAQDCIHQLCAKLRKAEAENILVKEELLLGRSHKDHELSPTTAKECIRTLNEKLQKVEAELVLVKEQLLLGTSKDQQA